MAGLLDNPEFEIELQRLAVETGAALADLRAQSIACLAEMRGDRSRLGVSLFAWVSRYICRRGYDPDYYHDRQELEAVRELAARQSVVYLVTHKTYLDFFVLFDFFYRNGIEPPCIFGGINMAFAGFGRVARRAGGIFIRRSFADDLVYKAVLRRYIQHLIGEGRSFSWAIEGTRSRTGKLVLPKIGLLKYVVDASRPLGNNAISYIPVSVSYDQIPDIIDMAAQEAGVSKKPESLRWFVDYVRGLRSQFGNIYVRFAHAVKLHDTPEAPDLHESRRIAGKRIVEVEKLAFEVCYRINEVTPATTTSLVLMSLLCRTSTTSERIFADVALLQRYMRRRNSASLFAEPNRPLDNDSSTALDVLLAKGIVRRDGNACSIEPRRYLVALYYSNMAVHHFVVAALTELGLLCVARDEKRDGWSAFVEPVLRLRDVFKFEFFFSRQGRFREQLVNELQFLGAGKEAVGIDRAAANSLLGRQPLLVAYGALSPFIAAYQLVARCLQEAGANAVSDEHSFIAGCQARARNGGTTGFPVIASKTLLKNGYLLAGNRQLLGRGPGIAEHRTQFADEIGLVADRLGEIRRMTN